MALLNISLISMASVDSKWLNIKLFWMQTISNTPTHYFFFFLIAVWVINNGACVCLLAFPACSSSSSWYGELARQEQRGQYPTQIQIYAYIIGLFTLAVACISTWLSICMRCSVNRLQNIVFFLNILSFSDRYKIGKAARAAGQRRRLFMLRIQSISLCRVSYRRSFRRS